MALNFPSSPVDGQIYFDSTSGNRYVYVAATTKWQFEYISYTATANNTVNSAFGVANAAFGVANAAFGVANNLGANVSQTAPSSPSVGSLWFNTDLGKLFVYYTDVDSSQWVEASGSGLVDYTAQVTSYVGPAYDVANLAFNKANSAYTVTNAAFGVANAAFGHSNTTYNAVNSAFGVINAAFNKANTGLLNNTDNVLVAGSFQVANNLFIANNAFVSNTLTTTGSSSSLSFILTNAAESANIQATAATGTINFDVATQGVLYYTTNASANWTINFRGSSGTSLNTLMVTGQSITVAHLVTQGATPYYNNAYQIDGNPVTPKWQGGIAPSAGNASGIDLYTYTIIKTASATFTVLASQVQYT